MPTKETGSKRRLEYLIRELQCNGQYVEYDAIILEQLMQGVIEIAPENYTGKEFFILHNGVNRKYAVSTKPQIVYDASS